MMPLGAGEPSLACETRALRKYFGRNRAVDGLDLRVPQGMLYAFLGPNGAGKTTSIRLIAGLLKPNSGEVFIQGISVTANPSEAKHPQGAESLQQDPRVWNKCNNLLDTSSREIHFGRPGLAAMAFLTSAATAAACSWLASSEIRPTPRKDILKRRRSGSALTVRTFASAILMIVAAIAVGLQAADAFPLVMSVFYAITVLGDIACFFLVTPNELSGEPQTA